MRLRDSVRSPERYKAEEFCAPFTPKSTRERQGQRVPAYGDYNPNLPPAAFPTLDKPRATESYANRFSKEDNGDGNGIRGDNRGTLDGNNIEGWPMNHLDTDIASHGAGYYTISALREGPRQLLTDMGNNDHIDLERLSFDEYMMEPETSYYDLDWSHLSPQLQLEIFNNLLQHHDWSTVCRMLGVIEQEEEVIQEALDNRVVQISLEDFCLKDMRQRQLNALLRRDNSARHKGMHEELLFRKVSRQSTRRLIERPEIDYFSCRESDLVKAELFIRKRALDPWIIGEWSNGTITSTSPSASMSTNENGDSVIVNKRRLAMKSSKSASANSSHALQLCIASSTAPSRRQALHPALPDRRGPRSQRVVRLKIGAQRAAQVQDFEQVGDEPNRLPVESPEIESHDWGRPCEIPARTGKLHGIAASPSSSSTTESTSGPLWTTQGRKRPCNSNEPRLESLSSSTRLRERLEQVHLEAQRQREQAQTTRISGIQSPPTSPVILMSEDGINELYQSDNDSYSVISVTTHDQRSYSTESVEMSGRSSAYRPITPPLSAIRPSFTPPAPASECRYESYVQSEDHCGYEEDDTVMARQISEGQQADA